MTNAGQHPWLGRTLDGRYAVRSLIGSGGMAHVLLADDERTGRKVAVKVPRTELADGGDLRERFRREMKVLLGVQHANVVRVLDIGECDGMPYFVMEHAAGGSLEDALRRTHGRQAPADVLPWLERVGDVLDTLHRDGHVHRDVKPANILFDAAGQARLSDFGIARLMQDLSQSSSLMLTFEYAPPEAFTARAASPAYDQYSLAATAYRALSGEPPHADAIAGPPATLMYARLERPPRDLAALAPNVPPAAASAVMRGLGQEPSQRFASCGELAAAFRAGLSSRGEPAAAPARAKAPPRVDSMRVAAGAGVLDDAPTADAVRPRAEAKAPSADVPAKPASADAVPERFTRRRRLVILGVAGAVLLAAFAYAGFVGFERRSEPRVDRELSPVGPNAAGATRFRRASDGAATVLVRTRDGAGFCMDEREMTWRQVESLARRAGFVPPRRPAFAASSEHPAVGITWDMARRCCDAAGARLPTQREWLDAWRGTDGRRFPWGSDFDCHLGNFDDVSAREGEIVEGCDGFRVTAPVGTFPRGASQAGVLDLAGNAREWLLDAGSTGHLAAGGAWNDGTSEALLDPIARADDTANEDQGFRCVQDAP